MSLWGTLQHVFGQPTWSRLVMCIPSICVAQALTIACEHMQAKGRGIDASTHVLLKAYQPPEELAACREGDLFVVHDLADKYAYQARGGRLDAPKGGHMRQCLR